MAQSLKILFNATPREVVAHLPISLGRIREIAEECTTVAESVVTKYNRVIDTLHELQIGSLAAQGKSQEAKKVADFESEQKKIEKNSLDQVSLFYSVTHHKSKKMSCIFIEIYVSQGIAEIRHSQKSLDISGNA